MEKDEENNMSVEICSVGDSKVVKAKKAHRCCECGKVINKGDMYSCFTGCWPQLDGWGTYKTCLRCEKIRELAEKKYPQFYHEDYAGFGCLYAWIRKERK